MRYLGIDYGTKKTGLALSDEAGTMGFPHHTLPTDSQLLPAIRTLIAAEQIDAVVIGDSLNFSGEQNPVAKSAREFGKSLHTETGLPVFYEIEMLTTQEARRGMDGAHPQTVSNVARSRVKKGTDTVDASAAALILTSFLTRQKAH